ncbi:hypothetical protein Mgra_00005457 [Meloidogyne graminicola]|uniref:MIF4G domain-containing protein n=1 Tax=Meloidogyne graminicola TaxID=189291 RepID=A0A8S9ZPH8_9BILA|nr:hypothetical protein Mgra_00005457 [Meloidogyne graminicola]
MDKQHSYCPPSTTFGNVNGNDFSGVTNYRPLDQQFQSGGYGNYDNSRNSIGIIAETSSNAIYQQNGGIRGTDTTIPLPSQTYSDASPMRPSLHSIITSSTGFPTQNVSPQKSYNPFGYKNRNFSFQRNKIFIKRSSAYNIQQQGSPNFIPARQATPNFIVTDQQTSSTLTHQSTQFIGGNVSGVFSTSPLSTPITNATGTSVPLGGRPSTQIPSTLPSHTEQPQSFLSMAEGSQQLRTQIPQQQPSPFPQLGNNSGVRSFMYQPRQYNSAVGGTNTFDMSTLLYDSGIDNGNRQMGPTMNGTMNGEFNSDLLAPEMQEVSARYDLSNELVERIQASSKKTALYEFQVGLEQIAFGLPTNFNTWATVIKDRMVGIDPLPEPDLRIAAEILIEMAVVLDESQYNFSCFCQFLDKHIEDFSQNILLAQLNLFISDTQSSLSLQHYCNLLIFLAELYDKIEVKGVKSSQLAAHLFDQLHGLLKLPSDDQAIGVIVKVLKLTGRFLENDRGFEAMNAFMAELNECASSCSISTKEKVRNLLELRNKHWGIVAETARVDEHGSNGAYPIGLLGPDGEQLIPDDEYSFLDENFSPSGSPSNNPIEEDNVEDDYERFLQATAERVAENTLVSFDQEDTESVVSSPPFTSKPGTERMS